jgi:hypothetical protein
LIQPSQRINDHTVLYSIHSASTAWSTIGGRGITFHLSLRTALTGLRSPLT